MTVVVTVSRRVPSGQTVREFTITFDSRNTAEAIRKLNMMLIGYAQLEEKAMVEQRQ